MIKEKEKDRVSVNMLMALHMKDSGREIKDMAMVSLRGQMATNIEVFGNLTSNTDKEWKFTQMDQSSKDLGIETGFMEMALYNILKNKEVIKSRDFGI